jgi:hypothetical protein
VKIHFSEDQLRGENVYLDNETLLKVRFERSGVVQYPATYTVSVECRPGI